MLVTFSGCDGSGKSTQIFKLLKLLQSKGFKAKWVWGRGGYTPFFTALKFIVLWIFGKNRKTSKTYPNPERNYLDRRKSLLQNKLIARVWLTCSIMDLFLYYACYVRTMSKLGIIVICDRYIADTKIDFENNFSEQFNANGFLWRLLEITCPKPTMSIVMTISVAHSIERSHLKLEPFPDDEKTLEFRLSCYNSWPEFTTPGIVRIDGSQPVNDIHKKISNLIFKELKVNEN